MRDLKDLVSGPAKDLLEASGESVTLVNRTIATDSNGDRIYDEYGDPEYDETTTSVTAEIVLRGTPQFDRRVDGISSDVAAVAWVADDHVNDVHKGNEEDRAPTRLESDTHEFVVYDWFDEQNGKLRLHLGD